MQKKGMYIFLFISALILVFPFLFFFSIRKKDISPFYFSVSFAIRIMNWNGSNVNWIQSCSTNTFTYTKISSNSSFYYSWLLYSLYENHIFFFSSVFCFVILCFFSFFRYFFGLGFEISEIRRINIGIKPNERQKLQIIYLCIHLHRDILFNRAHIRENRNIVRRITKKKKGMVQLTM